MVNVSLLIIPRRMEILHQITLGTNHLGIDLEKNGAYFGDQFFNHEGGEAASYQHQQDG